MKNRNGFYPKGIFEVYCWNLFGNSELIEIVRPLNINQCLNLLGKEKWSLLSNNITVDEGLNNILDVYFKSGSASANWYIGLKGTNETPAAGWDAAGIGEDFTESEIYSELVRQEWVTAAVSSKTITNSASPATFNIDDSGTIYGAFLVSNSTKGGTSGKMWCCSDFSVARPVVNGDTLKIVYTIQSQDV